MGAESEEDLYNMLGLDYGASEDEVREAARDLMGQYHPDNEYGDADAYKTIRQVRDILTGEALEEPDFLDMDEYEDWQDAEDFFSEDVMDERVSGLDKLMYGRFRSRMEQQRLEEALKDADEARGTDYHERYQQLQERRPSSMDEKVETEVQKELLKAEALGRDVDEDELRDAVESHFEERKEKVNDAINVRGGGFSYGSSEKYPDLVENELTDITAHGDLTFVEEKSDQDFQAVPRADQDDEVVRVSLVGDAKVQRDNDVYVKVPDGSVTVKDPDLRGAIQVWEGDVSVDLNSWDSFGVTPPVVRADAPEVNVRAGYEQRGDVYVPTVREVDGRPEADLAVEVRDGSVTLRDSQPIDFGTGSNDLKDLGGGEKIEDVELNSYLEDDDDDPFDKIL